MRGRGFSLIELIVVIVILSILALGTTRYIVNSTRAYNDAAERGKLVTSGRIVVEQITRRLRNALPNSIRVSASGQCIEYLPILEGTFTTGPVPLLGDPATTSLAVATYTVNLPSPNYAVIAPFTATELYSLGNVIHATNLSGAQAGATAITFGAGVIFERQSPANRIYLVSNPQRICINATDVLLHQGYGVLATLNDSAPAGATTQLIAENINAAAIGTPFTVSTSNLVKNSLVDVNLNFIRNGDPFELNHRVHFRNVP